jgi:acyl-CoA synthetase (AMP-forming)/AMP-acid ligase II
MSNIQEPANLADMVRAQAKNRGEATVYEFEGRRTSFAEFDIRTNRVANALRASGVGPRERIAYVGKNSDVYSPASVSPASQPRNPSTSSKPYPAMRLGRSCGGTCGTPIGSGKVVK